MSKPKSPDISLSHKIIAEKDYTKQWTHLENLMNALAALAINIKSNEKLFVEKQLPSISVEMHSRLELSFNQIIAYGVYPNLDAGIGLPWELRSKSKKMTEISDLPAGKQYIDFIKSVKFLILRVTRVRVRHYVKPDKKRLLQVWKIFEIFVPLKETEIVMSLFQIDILTILIQLRIMYTDDNSVKSLLTEYSESTDKVQLVRNLILLLNIKTASTHQKQLCSILLSKIVTQENGIRSITNAICGPLESYQVEDQGEADMKLWNALRRLGTLLSIIPKNVPKEIYLQSYC